MKMIFSILIILIGAYFLFTDTKFSWFGFANERTQSEHVENAERIVIDVSGVNTEIVPESRRDLHAELKGKGDLELDRRGDEIKINVRKGWFHWFGFDRSNLTIYLPEDYNQNLVLRNGSGNLNFIAPQDNMILKSLQIDMNSGNLEMENIHVEKFNHNGSSGNVEVSNLKTNSGRFDLSSGNVKIKEFSGALKADLSSGKFNVQMNELTGDIQVDVSSGSANIDLPKDADFTLKGQMSSGNIDYDFPLENKISDRKRIEGIRGSGDHRVDLSVSSGHIKIH